MVVLESWLAGTPVLVNGGCHPTRDHAADSNGGLWFTSYAEFEVALERLSADSAFRDALASAGREYTELRYRKRELTDRYLDFCERRVHAASLAR